MTVIKNDTYYLEKIKTDLDFIISNMKGVTEEELKRNELLSDSMHFRLIQIQENAKQLTDEFKSRHKDVQWTDIAGLRNHIVHDYGNVDFGIVFETLTNDIPKLRAQLEK